MTKMYEMLAAHSPSTIFAPDLWGAGELGNEDSRANKSSSGLVEEGRNNVACETGFRWQKTVFSMSVV